MTVLEPRDLQAADWQLSQELSFSNTFPSVIHSQTAFLPLTADECLLTCRNISKHIQICILGCKSTYNKQAGHDVSQWHNCVIATRLRVAINNSFLMKYGKCLWQLPVHSRKSLKQQQSNSSLNLITELDGIKWGSNFYPLFLHTGLLTDIVMKVITQIK